MNKIKHLILLLTIISCNSQIQKNKNIKIKDMITKDFERFDFNELLQNGKTTKGGREKGLYESLSHTKKNGELTIYLYGIKNEYYSSRQYSYNNHYVIVKIYNGEGIIKEKGICFNSLGETRLGVWYEYDENGHLIKETNYDKNYKFSFNQVLDFCMSKKMILEKGDIPKTEGGFHTKIRRYSLENKPVWIIEYQDGIKPEVRPFSDGEISGEKSIYEQIILDGETGKIISEKTIGLED